ncbi:hypothetical protein A2U01_0079621, partial [Trifolium medium]|nr:hypothetical protein [Trifolium medium]
TAIQPVEVKQLPAIVTLCLAAVIAAATVVVYAAVGVAAAGIVGVAAAVADSYKDSSLA